MMHSLRSHLAAVCAILFLALAAAAQEPIRFARTPDISPDGKTIAFSYRGDIWTVDTIGGVARPVTMHPAHEIYPAFSPDGRHIAFSSNRFGSYDVFVVPSQGGSPKRLTFDSATDYVCGWTPDGKHVLFSSNRGTGYPSGYDLYTVPVEGGQVRRITTEEGRDGVYSAKGDQLAYVRGPGLWYRKGYRGSSQDDVWICNADGTNNRQVTNANCQDDSPMWSLDGRFLYYVSEVHGTPANIVRKELGSTKPPELMTFHKDDAVRRARISGDGEWMVYECGADLWVASTRVGIAPRKLAIEVNADDKINPEKTLTISDGATEFAVDKDERHIAFVVRGEIFLMPLPNGKVTRLTNDPAYDHGIAWSPDGTKMIFTSDRHGHEDLYLLEAEEAGKKLYDVTKFKTTQITDTPEAEVGVTFSPDGKRVGFLRGGKLWTMTPDGKEQKVLVGDMQIIDFEWSPDSKWIAYARVDGSFASEIYIVPTTGGESHNITRYATFNAGITWSKTGMKLAFLSERRHNTGMYVVSLQKPTAENTPAGSEIDWEDIHLRAQSVTPLPAEEGAISPDGNRVAFRGVNDDLWVASTNGGHLTRVTSSGSGASQIQWSNRFSNGIYYRDAKGTLRLARITSPELASLLGGQSGSSSTSGRSADMTAEIPFRVKMTVRQDQEFAEMFEQSWRALFEHFYDPKFHGVDWAALRARYKPLVQHCVLKEDLYALISLMMGELNASHLGISGHHTTPEEETADLGLIFDDHYAGPGLKVAEVLKRGPADKRGIKLMPGDVIVAIDGQDLSPSVNLSQLLNGRVGETLSLQVIAPGVSVKDPMARRKVDVQTVSRGQIVPLMYDRWVANNAKHVNELSKGKLGYIHIPSMDEAGLDRFVRSLYSDTADKDAIVIDVRFNGGGFTHDQVLNYLGGHEHTLFRQRDGNEGWVLRSSDRKWSKPLIVLINNRSYSDAEIFPNAFRTLGMGKLVGQPTGGMVIGTTGIRLIDGSMFRIPRTGVFTLKGVNMEREGVQPDVLIENQPDQLAKGQDAQLDKAVEVLQQDVVVWKAKHGTGVVIKPADEKPGAGSVTPGAPGGNK